MNCNSLTSETILKQLHGGHTGWLKRRADERTIRFPRLYFPVCIGREHKRLRRVGRVVVELKTCYDRVVTVLPSLVNDTNAGHRLKIPDTDSFVRGTAPQIPI